MNQNSVYSVVDLEATGTDSDAGDRIIQFSCTFVQHRRVIDTFSTLINPMIPIPDRITKLTGITDAMVHHAPKFADVADLLYRMLNKTVFVAHNVNFDFPFLNAEFARIDHPKLLIQAIDTVTMSQILLPTLPSYQLRRISAYFNIVHRHPHSASSDARATADLLILLFSRLDHIPVRTLAEIIQIHPKLPRNTLEVFRQSLADRHHSSLPSFWHFKRGVVVRKFSVKNHHDLLSRFRVNRNDQKLIHQLKAESIFRWLIQNDRRKHPHVELIEAILTVRCQLELTLAMIQIGRSQRRKLVISTDSNLIRQRWCKQILPILNDDLPFHVSSVDLGANHDYINLNQFVNTLADHSKSNLTQLVKAKILVWLTMTKTGDLNELHLSHRIPYLKTIQNYQFQRSEHFTKIRLRQRQAANVILVDHRNLPLLTKHSYRKPILLAIDALQLPAAILDYFRFRINLNSVNVAVRNLISDLERTHQANLFDVLPGRFRIQRRLKRLLETLNQFRDVYSQIVHRFSITFLQPHLLKPFRTQLKTKLPIRKFGNFFNQQSKKWRFLGRRLNLIDRTTKLLMGYKKGNHVNQMVLDRYRCHVKRLNHLFNQFRGIDRQLNRVPDNCTFAATTNLPHNVARCVITGGLINAGKHLKNLRQQFSSLTLVDSAFQTNGHYVLNRLKLPGDEVEFRSRLSSQIKVRPQLRIMVPRNVDQSQIVQFWARSIIEHVSRSQGRLIVGLASFQSTRQLFDQLTNDAELTIPVYAEKINGSFHRIRHRLVNVKTAVILVQLPRIMNLNQFYPREFNSVWLAELPFYPTDQFSLARVNQVTSAGQNAQRTLTLPFVILTLKRALADLTFYQNNLTVLDPRILTGDNRQIIRDALPNWVQTTVDRRD